jgi:hypothetical protein
VAATVPWSHTGDHAATSGSHRICGLNAYVARGACFAIFRPKCTPRAERPQSDLLIGWLISHTHVPGAGAFNGANRDESGCALTAA